MTIDTFQFIKRPAALVNSLFLVQSSFADTVVMLSGVSAQDRDQDGIAFLISDLTQANDQAYAPSSADQVTANIAFSVGASDLLRVEESSLLSSGSWGVASDLSDGLAGADCGRSNFFDLSELTSVDRYQKHDKVPIDSFK